MPWILIWAYNLFIMLLIPLDVLYMLNSVFNYQNIK